MDYLNGINTPQAAVFGLTVIFKIFFLVLIFGYVLYALLLTLRVRILNDTVKTSSNRMMILLSYTHLITAIGGSLLTVILILVG